MQVQHSNESSELRVGVRLALVGRCGSWVPQCCEQLRFDRCVSECDGGLEEIPVYALGGQQGNISYKLSDIVAVDRGQRRPYAGNLIEWRCDSVGRGSLVA
ncbi:hypothetical protein CRG98_035335 [Punica granatum]|uniref:Uncharacterized protein n=1 Tax=Punica granatum TaxID=22663 RepID=A0A2I0IJS2_PUNGR|nr:hypothetical protein CRG98_035335 [Punica granatum]